MHAGSGHWDEIYRSKAASDVSWFQPDGGVSFDLITTYGLSGPVVDVGAGASVLVDQLLGSGWGDVTLLDLSSEALDETRGRLGPDTTGVRFVVADVLGWHPDRRYSVWHDRAAFHFLIDPAECRAYVRTASRSVEPGGVVVLGTFAEDGPEHCSGLPTARYAASMLADLFADDFELVEDLRRVHRTPWGSEQSFTWVVLRRRPEPAS